MAVTFDPAVGVRPQEVDELRQEMREAWQTAFREDGKALLNVDPETPAGQIIDSETALIAAKDSELTYLANMFNPDTAEGVWQDALAKIYFIDRKRESSTIVECDCMGRMGTVIPAGSLARTGEGRVLVSVNDATIPEEGTIKVSFKVQETGVINIAPHEVNTIITIIPGWDTIDNELAGVPGRLEESRAEFEARRRKSVAINAHGTAAAVYAAVAALDGVLACLVLENDMTSPILKYGVRVDGHSLCIIVYGGADVDIARAIFLKKDAGCGTCGNADIRHIAEDYYNAAYDYKILRPTPVRFRIRLRIQLADDASVEAVRLLREAVLTDFNGLSDTSGNGRVMMAETVRASRFYHSAICVAGVKELLRIEIAVKDGNFADYVVIRGDEIPVLDADDIEIEVVRDAQIS